jgi:membrane associated rhomboid family serine protease
MFENFISALVNVLMAMKENALQALFLTAILWGVHIVNFILNYRLNILGLYPRKIRGIPGIIFSPFLHGSFTHLFFNSLPFFVLIDFMLMGRPNSYISISIFIILVSNIALWLFGRRGIHVGASSLVMGYLSYLLINAWEHPSVKTIILGIICIYYFGSLLLSVFPKEERVSWEGHLFGLAAGVLAVFW